MDEKIVIPMREEYAKLLAEIASLDERAREVVKLVQLLALSRIRLGEAAWVVWREVDFAKGQFTVWGGEIGTKKGEMRIVPLFPRLRGFLEEIRLDGADAGGNRIVGIDSSKSGILSACAAGGLPRLTHHSLRHFFVSNAIEMEGDFKTIAAWIGHKDRGLLAAKTNGDLREHTPRKWHSYFGNSGGRGASFDSSPPKSSA